MLSFREHLPSPTLGDCVSWFSDTIGKLVLRFSARMHDGASEVRFERAVRG
jgi:hypothetical protein